MEITNASVMAAESGHNYPLEWLDKLITHVLDPAKADVSTLTIELCESIHRQLPEENTRLQVLIKTQVFNLSKKNEISLLIKRYHSLLCLLSAHNLDNQNHAGKTAALKKLYTAVQSCLDSLLSFIEIYYSEYLGLDERAPATFVSISVKEIRKKSEVLKAKAARHGSLAESINFVFKGLEDFTHISRRHYEPTYRKVLYLKELVAELQKLNWDEEPELLTRELHELLIYMNFNSRAYIRFLIDTVEKKVKESRSIPDQMDQLLYWNKIFNQLHRKPAIKYNPGYHDLETVISNWFVQEIRYLEKKFHWSSVPLLEPAEAKKTQKESSKVLQKVLIQLSSDQAGLILRAADQARVLVAKSLSEIFRTIVPHLSTPHNEELSYKGMRTQSYVAEQRDKDIAIEALERIIKKLRDL